MILFLFLFFFWHNFAVLFFGYRVLRGLSREATKHRSSRKKTQTLANLCLNIMEFILLYSPNLKHLYLFHTGFHSPLANTTTSFSSTTTLLYPFFLFLFLHLFFYPLNAKLKPRLSLGVETLAKYYLQNEGFFRCSNRWKIPIKWWSYPNGWNHKAWQEMQRHHCSCDLYSFLDCNDCKLQLWFQPRKPTKVKPFKFPSFSNLSIVLCN